MLDILRIEFLLELPKKNNIKHLLGFVGLLIFSYSSMENTIKLNRTELVSFCVGIFFITVYNSCLFILSNINSKYNKLWMVLPVRRKEYYASLGIIFYVKKNLLKITPFIIAFILVGISNRDLDIFFGIEYFVILNLIAIGASIIGLVLAILYNTLKSPIKSTNKRGKFRSNSFIYSWFKREYICFIKNKLFLINHFAYAIFITVFLFNIEKFNSNFGHTALLSIILIHLSSTASFTYSKDKKT